MKNKIQVTLLESWRTINQLKILKDLIRHETRWAHEIGLARPLNKLGISEKDPHRYQLVKQKINMLLPIAIRASKNIGTPTDISTKVRKVGSYPIEYEEATYHIFLHHDNLMSKDKQSAHYFNMTIATLDHLIGAYTEARKQKLFEFLNPLRIIAAILRIPITVLEYMGFESKGKVAEYVLTIILRAIWILFLAVITVYYGGKSPIVREILKIIQR